MFTRVPSPTVRWQRSKKRGDLIDMRGGGGGGRGGLPMAGGGLGLAGLVIVLRLQVLGGGGSGGGFDIPAFDPGVAVPASGEPIPPGQDPERDFKEFSLAMFSSANDTWEEVFRKEGSPYQRSKLVLYRGGVSTACGSAPSSVGPFYCPGDQRVYIDLSFYEDMKRQLNAPGDFAWAYVIAHEVGHHVQRVSGTEAQVRQAQRSDPDAANELSVRMELQADCYSGIWARAVYDQLEPGDVEEAMRASQAVGDDRLQQQAGRTVDPDSFTHGSSEQRARWFDTGRSSGDPAACDTFAADNL